MHNNLTRSTMNLNHILCVPQITKNLLSINKLTKDNPVFIEFYLDRCIVKDLTLKKELLQGRTNDGLYRIEVHQPHTTPSATTNQSISNHSSTSSSPGLYFQSLLAKSVSNSKVDLWHRRLGHLNYNVLKYMLSKENVSFKYNLTFDDACHVGKFKNTTYNSSSKSLTQPLELIHSDVWGPSPILSKDGFRYYVHFVDDYNNFSRIFPLKLKYVVKHVFQNF